MAVAVLHGTDKAHHTHNKEVVLPLSANEVDKHNLHNRDNHEVMAGLSSLQVADTIDGHNSAVEARLSNFALCDLHDLPVAAWSHYRLLLVGSCKRLCRVMLRPWRKLLLWDQRERKRGKDRTDATDGKVSLLKLCDA